jgi:type IV pilus assembly protein PilP
MGKKLLHILLLTAACLSLVACDSNEDQDINKFIEDTKHNAKPKIEKIPYLGKVLFIQYTASNVDSPFSNKNNLSISKEPSGTAITTEEVETNNIPGARHVTTNEHKTQPRPDTGRKREFLESSPLSALKMIGTLAKNHHYWALIADESNKIHIVGINDYIGENSGQVTNINEDKVTLKEIIPDGQGGWMTREANINLTRKGN